MVDNQESRGTTSDESQDTQVLRQRIASLERELADATDAQRIAEENLIAAQLAPKRPESHRHHANENMRLYGRSDGVVFIEPQTNPIPEKCIQIANENHGLSGLIARTLLKYNLDRLATRPVLHQWLENGKVVREATERQSSKFELFFDLLFVGIIHQIAEAAAEQPNGIGLAKYILTFCPAFSIWGDIRDTVNQFGSDDVFQRVYILWIMLLLVGYSNNATAIEFGHSAAVTETAALAVDEETHARELAIQWTMGFFVVAKFSKVLLHLFYASFLPRSRKALAVISINAIFACILFLIAIFLPLNGQITLVAIAIFSDLVLRLTGVLVIKTVEAVGRHKRRRGAGSESPSSAASSYDVSVSESNASFADEKITGDTQSAPLSGFDSLVAHTRKTQRIPAINIEHHVERLGAFVTIVLGEIVVNSFFKNTLAAGLNATAGRSFFALMLAFNLNWLYFDSEACREFIHALRRHWMTSVLFTYIHIPLIMSLLLASSAVNKLVLSDDVGMGLKYFFGTGVGLSIICMATLGLLHKRLDKAAGVLGLGRGWVFGTRYAAGTVMALLPLAHERFNSIQFLGIYVGITGFLIAEEVLVRIEERREGIVVDD